MLPQKKQKNKKKKKKTKKNKKNKKKTKKLRYKGSKMLLNYVTRLNKVFDLSNKKHIFNYIFN